MLLERQCMDKERQVEEKKQYIIEHNQALQLETAKLQNEEEDMDEEIERVEIATLELKKKLKRLKDEVQQSDWQVKIINERVQIEQNIDQQIAGYTLQSN